jgi:hypothetical protein
LNLILSATKRSKKITESARHLSSIIKYEDLKAHKFAALHWRYDLEDWADGRWDTSLKMKLLMIRRNPRVLVNFIQDQLKHRNISRMVMFSPPSDSAFLDELRSQMENIKIYTEKEIIEFFKSDLDKIDADSEVSLLEQEICLLSDFFLYSVYSTWSSNILLERMIVGHNDFLKNIDFEIKEEDTLSSLKVSESNQNFSSLTDSTVN